MNKKQKHVKNNINILCDSIIIASILFISYIALCMNF